MKKQGLGIALVAMATALSLGMAPAMADPGNHGPDDMQMDHGPGAAHGQQKHASQADAGPDGQAGRPGQPGQPAQPGPAGMHYQQARRLAVNHGLTGYQPLPPGMAKRLARGKPLPPGIERRPVPPEMLRQLPVRPGYEWRIVGDDLVQIAVTTAIVSTIMHGVFD